MNASLSFWSTTHGHARNYTIGDVIARYQRMLGETVLQPSPGMRWPAC
ncbi:hypothetical protein ACNKHO_04270 [Shigella flexneri]